MQITLNNKQYRINKASAMEQFHLGRKLGGLIDVKNTEGFIKAIGAMPDAEAEALLLRILRCVDRVTEGVIAPVVSNNFLMFADIELKEMMALSMAVLKENFGDFLQDLGLTFKDLSGGSGAKLSG